MSPKSTKTKDSMSLIREQALKDAAKTVKSIRRQKACEPDSELVRDALKNSEEAMFFLAVNCGGDDENGYRKILSKHNLDDIK